MNDKLTQDCLINCRRSSRGQRRRLHVHDEFHDRCGGHVGHRRHFLRRHGAIVR